MILLTVAGQTYAYPENRENAGTWGDSATSWAQAVTNVLASISGASNILQTVAAINNNVISPANVVGLVFSPTVVRGAIIEYSVYRVSTGAGATEAVETGTMYASYKSTAATWDLVVVGGAGAGVAFSMTSLGQVQYTSSNFTGSGYIGSIKFQARSLLQ